MRFLSLLCVWLGVSLIAAGPILYFENEEAVTVAEPEREVTLACGTKEQLTFLIHNHTRRAVRVVGVGTC